MELHAIGKKDRPPVLVLPGEGRTAEETAAALKKLKKSYRVLIGDLAGAEELPALEEALRQEGCGALWGAYGLDKGAEELLGLLERDRLDIRTRVVEGRFVPPEEAPAGDERIRCWTGKKDKEGKAALEALRARGWQASALTLKKLPKGESTLSYCPGTAAAQLKKAFGEAECVCRTVVFPFGMEPVWALLEQRPDPREAARLDRSEGLRRDEAKRTLLYQGSGGAMPVWVHRITLEAVDEGHTRVTDRICFRAGNKKFKKSTVKNYLLRLTLERLLALLKESHAV